VHQGIDCFFEPAFSRQLTAVENGNLTSRRSGHSGARYLLRAGIASESIRRGAKHAGDGQSEQRPVAHDSQHGRGASKNNADSCSEFLDCEDGGKYSAARISTGYG
jgi:hypothetical protein